MRIFDDIGNDIARVNVVGLVRYEGGYLLIGADGERGRLHPGTLDGIVVPDLNKWAICNQGPVGLRSKDTEANELYTRFMQKTDWLVSCL